MNRNVKYMASK